MSLSKDVKLVREAIATLAAHNSPMHMTAVSCLFDNLVNTLIVRKGVTIKAAEEREQNAIRAQEAAEVVSAKLRAENDEFRTGIIENRWYKIAMEHAATIRNIGSMPGEVERLKQENEALYRSNVQLKEDIERGNEYDKKEEYEAENKRLEQVANDLILDRDNFRNLLKLEQDDNKEAREELARIRQLLKLEQDGSSKLHADRDAALIENKTLQSELSAAGPSDWTFLLTERDALREAVQKLQAERDAERIHCSELRGKIDRLVQENATLKDGQELARIRQLLKLEQDGSSKLHAERDAERIHCSELRGKIDQLVREKSLESRECPIASHSCLLTERDGALLENERLQSELSIANRNVDFWKEANERSFNNWQSAKENKPHPEIVKAGDVQNKLLKLEQRVYNLNDYAEKETKRVDDIEKWVKDFIAACGRKD